MPRGDGKHVAEKASCDVAPRSDEIPRTAWGDPVFRGFWTNAGETPAWLSLTSVESGLSGSDAEISRFNASIPTNRSPGSMVLGTEDGKLPYQPWAKQKRDARRVEVQKEGGISPEERPSGGRCYQLGPLATMFRAPMEIFQYPTHLIFVWEDVHAHRVIWLDGRPALPSAIKLWQGQSRGSWEGNKLIVETTNFNGLAWLGRSDILSDELRLRETFEFQAADTIQYEVEVNDPKVYTAPWRMRWELHSLGSPHVDPAWIEFYKNMFGAEPGKEVMLEYNCIEERER